MNTIIFICIVNLFLCSLSSSLQALTANALMESKKHVDAFKEQYDILNAEDKVMDKAFKREFNDVTAVQQDQLYRLFRKRPRSVVYFIRAVFNFS